MESINIMQKYRGKKKTYASPNLGRPEKSVRKMHRISL